MISDLEYYRVKDNVNSYYRIESESKRELLLNKYPNAAAAYSLRLLDGYYRDPLIRVRREEDGVEVDVYPDYNNEVSLDSLVTNVVEHTTNDGIEDEDYTFQLALQSFGEFVGHGGYSSSEPPSTATVCVWYDQSGNGNDAEQDTASDQPLIYDSVEGDLVRENGKPAVEFNGTSSRMTSPMTVTSDFTTSVVLKALTASQSNQWLLQDTSGSDMLLRHKSTDYDFYDGTTAHTIGTAGTDQHHIFITANSSGSVVSFDGVNQSISGIGNNGYTDLEIGGDSGSRWWHGRFQEIVIYDSYEAGNRTGIEQDINDHYQIEGYTPPQPLLDEFDGAAAAYSLRKLRSSYTGPLVRVRRDSATGGDDVEVDVYPDENGGFSLLSPIEDGGNELSLPYDGDESVGSTDKNTLYEFVYGQSCDLMVVVWYDQAGSNDATQTTAANQPKIYDSATGVVTKNGKPAVLFSGAQYVDSSSIFTTTATIFAVLDNGGSTSQFFGTPDLTENSFYWDRGTRVTVRSRGKDVSSTITAQIDYKTVYYKNNSSNHEVAVNNQSAVSAVVTNPITEIENRLGARTGLSSYFTGHLYEFVIYASDQSTNRTGIESNINTYYSIY